MDNSSSQDGSNTQLYSGFSAVLQIFDSIENWLARLFELSDEEQENAGVHFYDERYE
jgi:hypothetical protein